MMRLIMKIMKLGIQSLSPELAIQVKESIDLVGKLDYTRGNIVMSLDSSKQLSRLKACSKEPETVEWIETQMCPEDIFYDLGANVGAYSFVAHAATGGSCTIYSFEPSFSTFAVLCKNILLNDCQGKIVPFHVALSHKTGLLTFNYSSITPGAAFHSLKETVGKDGDSKPEFTQTIPGYSLDDFVSQFGLQLPNHIKIDVDGAEMDILKGADKTLAYPGLRSILIEIDKKENSYMEIISLLEGKGFRIRSTHPRGGNTKSETSANYIFEKKPGSS